MNLTGTKTEKTLLKAFAGELQASFRYRCFADAARQAGMKRVAAIFEATALNELEHARHQFNFLGKCAETSQNIVQAIKGEAAESSTFYPSAAKTADEDGFSEIADFFRRMGKVEGKHEKNFRDLLKSIESGIDIDGQTVGHSALEMAQLMLPDQANPAGFVHGGELMKLMDNAAGVVAVRHACTNVVTGSVEDIKFINPVKVGDLAIVHGKLTFVSRSSMEVKIEVEAEELFGKHTGNRVPALTAYFIMVALDKDGKAVKVPPLILSTEEEKRLFAEGQERHKRLKKN